MIFARGIATLTNIELIVRSLLHRVTGHIALALLGGDIIDESLARFEVIAHCFRLVGSITVGKNGSSCNGPQGIGCPLCIYRGGFQVDGNLIGFQFYILIVDLP